MLKFLMSRVESYDVKNKGYLFCVTVQEKVDRIVDKEIGEKKQNGFNFYRGIKVSIWMNFSQPLDFSYD